MQVQRKLPQFVWVLFLSLVAFSAFGANVCTGITPANNGIQITSTTGVEAPYQLLNPISQPAPQPAQAVKLDDSTPLFWHTDPDPAKPVSSDPDNPFTLGYCGPSSNKTLSFSGDFKELTTAETVVIRFKTDNQGSATRYLTLKWTDSSGKPQTQTYSVTGSAGAPDYANDSRYKIWAYTGYTYLRSQNDFKDSFAELLVRVETRFVDGRIGLRDHDRARYDYAVKTGQLCDLDAQSPEEIRRLRKKVQKLSAIDINEKPDTAKELKIASQELAEALGTNCRAARFSIWRIYGEAGLTGTTSVTTGSDSLNKTTIGGTTEGFTGSAGLGYGRTVLVSALKQTDTSAFSVLFVPRLGLASVPATIDSKTGNIVTAGFTAFDYSLNARIENEPGLDEKIKAGSFEGAYSEIGFGESQQFSRKKFPRLRYDGLLPVSVGSDIFRFALRVQIDAPRPFAPKKQDPTSLTDNLASQIRISALFNLDLLALGKRISGTKSTTP